MSFLFSFLDLKYFVDHLKQKQKFITILYITCFGAVLLQLYEKIEIFNKMPTTASLNLVGSKDIPIVLTLCKTIHNRTFDGNFSSHSNPSLKNILLVFNKTETEIMNGNGIKFDFVTYVDLPLMCKDLDFSQREKNLIQIVRENQGRSSEANKNLHLYIYQSDMFYLWNEFGIKYQSNKFVLASIDDTNENAKVDIESYDISNDPHLSCSSISHKDCTNKEIIMQYNSTFGCTFPIQRYGCFFYIHYYLFYMYVYYLIYKNNF